MLNSTVRSLALALFALFALLSLACKPGAGGTRLYDASGEVVSAHAVDFTLLHINDVYEIGAVEGGTRGGLARVATVIKELKAENPHFLSVLPGDFLSPSAMGVTKVDGNPVAGQQMIETLNAMGLDLVTFGNHEFDLTEAQLRQRMSESHQKWISSNVRDAQGALFAPAEDHKVVTFKNEDGDEIRIGFFALCVDMVKKPFVTYQNYVETAKAEVQKLKDEKVDVIIALTHLAISDDKQVATEVPEIDVILGAHEHENTAVVAGDDQTPIYKADANARTVYVHRFHFDVGEHKLTHQSKLLEMDGAVALDPDTDLVVKKWTDKVFASLRAMGVEPTGVVGHATEMLEGFEAAVRNRPTNLSNMIGQAFLAEAPEADAVIYGSGSIRIDDRIPPGDITTWDIVRIFPFGGKMVLVTIQGSQLKKALIQGEANKGSGGYLDTVNVARDVSGGWMIKGQPLDEAKTYKVLFNDFLLTGLEKGLGFLNVELEADGLAKVRDTRDVRTVFVAKLQNDLHGGH